METKDPSDRNGLEEHRDKSAILYRLSRKTSLRKEPSSSSAVLYRFSLGDRVELLERTSKNWWEVRFKGQRGFVKAALLERLLN